MLRTLISKHKMYEYAYLIGIAYIFLLLLIITLLAKRSRKLIFYAALLWSPAAPILEYWHHQDYWNPVYIMPIQLGNWKFGFEDILLGAVVAGLCVGLFELLIIKATKNKKERLSVSGLIKLLFFPLVIGPIAMYILSSFLGLNSVTAIIILGFFTATLILKTRPEWITPALLTSIIITVVSWISYYVFYLKFFPFIIELCWHENVIRGVQLGGVPIEELLWALMTGLFCGPVSRFFLIAK